MMGCQQVDGETVGPRGGTVVSQDGRLSLEIDPGALAHEVDITITPADCATMDVDAAGPCYHVGPVGTAFLLPALLTVELEPGDVESAGEDDLALSALREHDWRVLADRTYDREHGMVAASATYLSSFAVVPVPGDHVHGHGDDDDEHEPSRD
ncbi:MAG: hypothetical protein U0168_06260 [Nannocystaceae bacterium]